MRTRLSNYLRLSALAAALIGCNSQLSLHRHPVLSDRMVAKLLFPAHPVADFTYVASATPHTVTAVVRAKRNDSCISTDSITYFLDSSERIERKVEWQREVRTEERFRYFGDSLLAVIRHTEGDHVQSLRDSVVWRIERDDSGAVVKAVGRRDDTVYFYQGDDSSLYVHRSGSDARHISRYSSNGRFMSESFIHSGNMNREEERPTSLWFTINDTTWSFRNHGIFSDCQRTYFVGKDTLVSDRCLCPPTSRPEEGIEYVQRHDFKVLEPRSQVEVYGNGRLLSRTSRGLGLVVETAFRYDD